MEALILFVLGAFFGLHLLTRILKNKPTKKSSIIFHSLFVISGVILTFMNWANEDNQYLSYSLLFFVFAAMGGVVMVFLDVVKKQKPPAILAIGHMLLALTGVLFVALYVFGK